MHKSTGIDCDTKALQRGIDRPPKVSYIYIYDRVPTPEALEGATGLEINKL